MMTREAFEALRFVYEGATYGLRVFHPVHRPYPNDKYAGHSATLSAYDSYDDSMGWLNRMFGEPDPELLQMILDENWIEVQKAMLLT